MADLLDFKPNPFHNSRSARTYHATNLNFGSNQINPNSVIEQHPHWGCKIKKHAVGTGRVLCLRGESDFATRRNIFPILLLNTG